MDNSQFLTRDEILGVEDSRYTEVEVPEWGVGKKVRLRAMTGTARDAFESSMIQGEGKNRKMNLINIRAKLAAMSIVDAEGNMLFTMHDIEALGRKSAAALDRIFEAAQSLSKLSDEDVEELVKNSGVAPSEDLSSD